MRDKREVAKLANLDDPKPFIYTSGRYPKATLHTTAVLPIAPGSKPGSVIVFDLRADPEVWADKTVEDLKSIRFAPYEARQQEGFMPLPAKELAYNKCPAVAPLGVLDNAAQERIQLDIPTIQKHYAALQRNTKLVDKLREVFARNSDFPKSKDVDASLYDGFINERDKPAMSAVRAADRTSLADFHPHFTDERLADLLFRYKARNYPSSLSEDERAMWEDYRASRIKNDLPRFSAEMQRLSKTATDDQSFLLSELHLWAESIVPFSE